MNKIFRILCIAALPLLAFSQEYEYIPFTDFGAIWSERYQPPIDMYGNFPPPIYESFALNGEDTILNTISYKKIYMFTDSIFDIATAKYVGGIREDENRKVYFKGDTIIHNFKPMINFYNYEEILLYDFKVTIGDTVRNINCLPEEDFIVVSNIDTVLINNTLRRKIYFDPMPWVQWIEGIGSVKGLLFTSGDLPMNGLNNDLICYKQNEEIQYFNNNYAACFPLLSSINARKNEYSDIKVFPNPSIDYFRFSFGEQNIKLIQIIDCNGRLWDSYNIKMQSQFLLSVKKYQPGIYFYKATNENGMIHTGKLVVR